MTRPFLILFAVAALSSAAHAASLQLAKDGKSSYAILISPAANEVECLAAEELQRYLLQITGARLAIVTETPRTRVIAVGDCDASKRVVVPSRYVGDDAFRICAIGQNLVLKGANPRGTLYAVYGFLERQGCWWFAPATPMLKDHHEYVPRKTTLTVPSLDLLDRPAMKYRKQDAGGSPNAQTWPLILEWMGKNRCNTVPLHFDVYQAHRDVIMREARRHGMCIEVGKHEIMPRLLPAERYFKDHPDWFGMRHGQRVVRDRQEGNRLVVFETASPDAVAEFERNLIAWLREHPEVDVFQIWPPDGCLWSESPESLALGSPIERFALLVQHVTGAMKEAGLKTRIAFLAYDWATGVAPPKHMGFDHSNIVEFCPIEQNYLYTLADPRSPKNANYDRDLKAWLAVFPGEVVHYSYYCKGSWRSLPVVVPQQIVQEVRSWQKAGEIGTNIYCVAQDWLAREVHHLIFAKASWSPNFDAGRWYEDYLKTRFGAAAPATKRYFALTTKLSLGALIRESRTDDLAPLRPLLAQARQAMSEAMRRAVTPEARWIVGKLAWQPDYLTASLKLREAETAGKPRQATQPLRAAVDALTAVHSGDGTYR